MKVSVVLAVYNGEQFLVHQLNSIKNQTRQVHEVIICDDASTDRSVMIIEDYIDQYSLNNWKITRNEENIGWIQNFHSLFGISTGDIIFPADQDDIWLDDKVEIMASVMERDPKVLVLGGNQILVDSDNKKKKIELLKWVKEKVKKPKEINKLPLNNKFYLTQQPGCATCFRRELLPYIEKMEIDGYSHDNIIWNIGYMFDGAYILEKDIIRYRRHPSSVWVKDNKNKNTASRIHELEVRYKAMITFKNIVINNKPNQLDLIKMINRTLIFFDFRLRLLKSQELKMCIKLLAFINSYPAYAVAYETLVGGTLANLPLIAALVNPPPPLQSLLTPSLLLGLGTIVP